MRSKKLFGTIKKVSLVGLKPYGKYTSSYHNTLAKLRGFFLGTTVRNGKFYRDCLWSGQTRLEVILRPRWSRK